MECKTSSQYSKLFIKVLDSQSGVPHKRTRASRNSICVLGTCEARSEQPACQRGDVASGLLLKHISKHFRYEGTTDHLATWSLTRKTGSSFGK